MKAPFVPLEKHLVEKWGQDRQCPMCGAQSWNVNDRVFELLEHDPDDETQHHIFPVVPVTCANCFGVQFLSAVALGLVKSNATEADDGEAE